MALTALTLSLLVFSAAGTRQRPGCGGPPQALLETKRGPNFSLPSLDDLQGAPVDLARLYAQQPVLLVFWTTWCPTCRSEVSELEKIHQQYGARGLKVLAVDLQESAAKVTRFKEKHPFSYTCLLDESGKAADLYAVDSLPTCVLLAKGGQILYYGFRLPQGLEKMIQAPPRTR